MAGWELNGGEDTGNRRGLTRPIQDRCEGKSKLGRKTEGRANKHDAEQV